MRVGLGLGRTSHSEATPEGEVGRKGISCERTFAAISAPADLEAKVVFHAVCPQMALVNQSSMHARFCCKAHASRPENHGGSCKAVTD